MIDLNNVEAYRENNRIEAKRATGGFPTSLWETYSALANTVGGVILLGVEERADKSLHVVGVPDSAGYIQTFWAHINNPELVSVNILAPEDVFVQPVDGKEMLVIQVPRADRKDRPVFLGGDPFTGAYRRDGEGDYHCTPDEVRSMLRDRGDTPADLTPIPELSLESLSRKSLRAFRLLMATRNHAHSWNTLPDEAFLPMSGAAAREGAVLHPTRAGLLLFGRLPEILTVFPSYYLLYRESGPNGARLCSNDGGWSGNLLDFYQAVSARIHRVAERLLPDQPALEASLREAAINAILHTDYFGGEGLRIIYSPEALEVRNSGLLRIAPERAQRDGVRDARNLGLTRLFALIGAGSGEGLRGIYATWAKQGWSAPSLSESFGPDATTLRLPLGDYRKDGPRQRLLERLTHDVSATVYELAERLSIPPVQVQKALSELQSDGLIQSKVEDGTKHYTLRA